MIRENISYFSIAIDLCPYSRWKIRFLKNISDDFSCQNHFFRYLPNDYITRKKWLNTSPNTEHHWIIPRSNRSNNSFRFIVNHMKFRFVFKNYLRNKIFFCMIKVPEKIIEPILDLIPSEPNRHSHLSCYTLSEYFFLCYKSIIDFSEKKDPLC